MRLTRSRRLARRLLWFCQLAALVATKPSGAQLSPVTAQVSVGEHAKQTIASTKGDGDVVVWLRALDPSVKAAEPPPTNRPKLTQHNKSFEPHLLVVQVGSVVDFPNRDPFFHNVFSMFEGKRFDLGLYEAGATHSVRFDRVGISFLFCNIHPEMSAVVVVVDTPYFGISDRSGRVSIPNVPNGRYEVHYWAERGLSEALRHLVKVVTISTSNRTLDSVQIAENPKFTLAHKNKYGQDYVPAPSTDYTHP